jgi:hypothetical protein
VIESTVPEVVEEIVENNDPPPVPEPPPTPEEIERIVNTNILLRKSKSGRIWGST